MKRHLFVLGLVLGAAAPLTLAFQPVGGESCSRQKSSCQGKASRQEARRTEVTRGGQDEELLERLEAEMEAIAEELERSLERELENLELHIEGVADQLDRDDLDGEYEDRIEDLEDELEELAEMLEDELEDNLDSFEDMWEAHFAEAWDEDGSLDEDDADDWEEACEEWEDSLEDWEDAFEDWSEDWEDSVTDWSDEWEDATDEWEEYFQEWQDEDVWDADTLAALASTQEHGERMAREAQRLTEAAMQNVDAQLAALYPSAQRADNRWQGVADQLVALVGRDNGQNVRAAGRTARDVERSELEERIAELRALLAREKGAEQREAHEGRLEHEELRARAEEEAQRAHEHAMRLHEQARAEAEEQAHRAHEQALRLHEQARAQAEEQAHRAHEEARRLHEERRAQAEGRAHRAHEEHRLQREHSRRDGKLELIGPDAFAFEINTDGPGITVLSPGGNSETIRWHELESLNPGTYVLDGTHGKIELRGVDPGESLVLRTDGRGVWGQRGQRQGSSAEVEELTLLLEEMRSEIRELRSALKSLRAEMQSMDTSIR